MSVAKSTFDIAPPRVDVFQFAGVANWEDAIFNNVKPGAIALIAGFAKAQGMGDCGLLKASALLDYAIQDRGKVDPFKNLEQAKIIVKEVANCKPLSWDCDIKQWIAEAKKQAHIEFCKKNPPTVKKKESPSGTYGWFKGE